jgi:hypothetical protein
MRRFTECAIFTLAVKKRELVNIAGRFEAEALRILREVPGLTVDAERGTATDGPDAVLRFAGNRAPMSVEVKRQVNAANAWQLVQRTEANVNLSLLVIAGETTAEARATLEDHGIGVIDGLGNAHIELPGLLLHLEGRQRPKRSGVVSPPTRLQGKAGVVAQALLLNPKRTWQVREVAKEAAVSDALAHRVLTRLEHEGIVAVEGTGPSRIRRVTNATALLDLWAEETADRPTRTLAYALAQTPPQLIRELGGSLARSGIDHALTGAAAGSVIAPFITALPVVEIWVKATAAPEDLYAAAGADPVTDGQNVVFLQGKDDSPLAFCERVHDLWLANRFRLYVDLRRDPRRGGEQANHLRREVIQF